MRPRAPAPPPWLPRTAASPRGAAHVREGRSRPLEGGRRLAHALGRHARVVPSTRGSMAHISHGTISRQRPTWKGSPDLHVPGADDGVELTTVDLNPRPSPWQGPALPLRRGL